STGVTMRPAGPSCAPKRPAAKMPCQAPCRRHDESVGSDTQTLLVRIDEDRRADLDLDVGATQRIDGANAFTAAGGSAPQQPEPDPVPELGRIGDRSHVALVVRGGGRLSGRDEMRAGARASGAIDRTETDEAWTIRLEQRRPGCHQPADVILLLRHHA